MMNLYFALGLVFVDKHTNVVAHHEDEFGPWSSATHKLMEQSDRVWRETDRGISFIKNRYTSPDTLVDMKEFMWIKLKSVAV